MIEPAEAETPNGAPLADIAQRSIARMIDSGIVVFVWLLITSVYFVEGREVSTAAICGLFLAGYEIIPVMKTGATFGKRTMSIAVVMAKTGQHPPLVNAFLRVAPAIPLALFTGRFFIIALPFLYSTAGFVASRRGLVDALAGTA